MPFYRWYTIILSCRTEAVQRAASSAGKVRTSRRCMAVATTRCRRSRHLFTGNGIIQRYASTRAQSDGVCGSKGT
jgi:hypothetical protein